jgi:disulfide bond formation protein DsbB
MINKLSKQWFMIAFTICLCIVFYSYYMELVQKLNPCILCLVERYTFIALTLILALKLALSRLLFCKHLKIIWITAIILISAFGIFICIHHYNLQNNFNNSKFISCGIPIGIYYEQNTLYQFVKHILYENIECARSVVYIFGINILFLEIIFFSIILLLTILFFLRTIHK